MFFDILLKKVKIIFKFFFKMDEYSIYIFANNDLNISTYKIASKVGHFVAIIIEYILKDIKNGKKSH